DWSDPAQGVAYVIFQGTSPPGALIFEGPSGNQQDVVDVMYSHDVTFDRVEIRNGDWHAGFYQYRGYNNKLTASYIHNNGRRDPACTDCFNLDNGVYWADTTGAGSLIANNVVEDNVAQGIQLYPTPSSQVTVEENTIVNNGNCGIVVYGSSQAVVNNILYNNGHDSRANNYQGQLAEYNGNTVIDHNVTYDDRGGAYAGWWNTSTCTSNCITNPNTANPTFVNPSASDWHL